jgi:hypothetical protein
LGGLAVGGVTGTIRGGLQVDSVTPQRCVAGSHTAVTVK